MNEVLENIKDLNLNIDSNSAVQIAEQYFQYKYVDMGLGTLCFFVFLAAAVYAVKIINK